MTLRRPDNTVGETARKGDPVTTEVIRHGLVSVAEQMKRVMVRTSVSPIIYETLDFAVALFDRDVRLLAQARTMLLFTGALGLCVEAAVDGVGGTELLDPGDVILYNVPYGSGSHPQDVAIIIPVFRSGRDLVGYAATKAHWLDIAGKDVYSTDTVDVHQEGTLFPGVKLWRQGTPDDSIHRIITANSRLPETIVADLHAQVAAARTGADGLLRIIRRFGQDRFERAVEGMLDHAEAAVREWFTAIPDGCYVGRGEMDDNGRNDAPVPFEIAIEVAGSTLTVDFTRAPENDGPVNCPLGTTVAASRVAVALLAGDGQAINEGHFRPIRTITTPGSLFHPLAPAPVFLYSYLAIQAVEVIFGALSEAAPNLVPACSGGCLCGMAWWGRREHSGRAWGDGAAHPVGQGGNATGDGANGLVHVAFGAARASVEVWEAKHPWLLERFELAPDSCGPGLHRGGLGVDVVFRLLEECYATPIVERTKNAPWGVLSGGSARANSLAVVHTDGRRVDARKATGLRLPAGTRVVLQTGGGGGFGDPLSRDPAAVRADLRNEYISAAHARLHYPHAELSVGGTAPNTKDEDNA